jgi:osmotically inducible protein OsmC
MIKIDPKYTATVTSTGGREGHAVSDDGVLDVQLRRPKLQGTNEGTNPEQLFAAAWAACYQGALNAITRDTDIDVSQSRVTAHVSMGPVEGGTGYGLAGKLEVAIPGLPLEKVQELANAANEVCPYSRAVEGNIAVEVVGVA